MVHQPYNDRHKATVDGVRNLIDDNTDDMFKATRILIDERYVRVSFAGRVPVTLIRAIIRSDTLDIWNIYPEGHRKGHMYIRYT